MLSSEEKQQLAEGLQPAAICELIDQAWAVWRNSEAETLQMFVLPEQPEKTTGISDWGEISNWGEYNTLEVSPQFTFPLADLFDEQTIITAVRKAFRAGKVYEVDGSIDPVVAMHVSVRGSNNTLKF